MEKESQPSDMSKEALEVLLFKNKMKQAHWFLENEKLYSFILSEPLFSPSDEISYRIAKRIADEHSIKLVPRDISGHNAIPDYRYFFALPFVKNNEAAATIPVLAGAKKAFEDSIEKLVSLVVEKRAE
jgi:hypothetical protein